MNRKATYLSALTMVAASAHVIPATAQTGTNILPPEVLACADEVDVMARLSCYDREIAMLREAPVAPVAEPPLTEAPARTSESVPATSAAPVEAVTAVVVTGAATPATVAEAAPVPEMITEDTQNPEPAESSSNEADFGYGRALAGITANVADLRELPHGELIILLDNGQIWEQKHVDRRFKLRIGEAVTIAKGPVAGFRLSGDSNRSIQVERRQ